MGLGTLFLVVCKVSKSCIKQHPFLLIFNDAVYISYPTFRLYRLLQELNLKLELYEDYSQNVESCTSLKKVVT